MSAVWIAITVAVIGPFLLAWLQGRQRTADMHAEAQLRREERAEDYARQDLVAERLTRRNDEVAAKAQQVAIQTQTAAQLLLQNNEKVAAATKAANTKLDVIHTLVNSNMTSALQGQLDAHKAQLVTLRELIALRVTMGQSPDDETSAALLALETRVGALAANLRDRIEQTKIADAQIFIAKEGVHDEGEPSDP